jgi:hypothetical protein
MPTEEQQQERELPRPGPELIREAAQDAEAMSDKDQADAAAWLMADDPSVAPVPQRTYTINVGTDDVPRKVRWTLRALDGDELRRLNRQDRGPVSRADAQDADDMETHARVVVAASVEPDVTALARSKGATDASRFLRQRFYHKPGLISQLSAMVMSLSGFDNADVEAEEVKAAGNS